MEKRVFAAIFLSFLVLAGYQAFFAPPPPVPAAPVPVSAAATPATGAAAASGATLAKAEAPAESTAAPLVADTARDIVVETDEIRAVFSTRGGTLTHWQLKHYLESGQPLELVPTDIPADQPRPFTLSTNDAALSRTLATALFRPSADGLVLGGAPGTLSFEYRDASGLNARKAFYFQPGGKPFVVKVEAAVDVAGASHPVTIAWGPGLGLGYAPDGSRSTPVRGAIFINDKVQFLAASALVKQSHYQGQFRFAGVEDQYFLTGAMPGSEPVTVDYTPVSFPLKNDPKNRMREFIGFSVSAPGALAVPYFMGPKDLEILRSVDSQLTYTIDFGMFRVIVTPLLIALKWINGYVGNFGWSIIALTVLINLIIFPLRHRSMVSMKKMQAVQPEVKVIQERYAKYKVTDPERQKMNAEMMALYKQKGVNPASGCVPMLLTMPVLFAFYAMLSAAIELRGAPFMGWLTDLSKHDPYYITPILMGATMLIQQRMMPTTADPVQAKMLLMMPVIFTVSFLWAPAGLVVYWFMSNLLAIGQQTLTNRIIGAPPARVGIAKRPAKPLGR